MIVEIKPEVLHPKEIWKDVIGYEGRYKVSTFGRVLGVKNKIMSQFEGKHKTNYLYVSLYIKDRRHHSKDVKVHKLVMDTFSPNPDKDKFTDIHHIDHNQHNNNISNLVRLSNKEHSQLEMAYRRASNDWYERNRRVAKARIGKKYGPHKNLYNPVYSTDRITGEFIKQYKNIRDTAEDGYSPHGVSKNLCGRAASSGGVSWHRGEYKDNPLKQILLPRTTNQLVPDDEINISTTDTYFARLNKENESKIEKIYYTQEEINQEGLFTCEGVLKACLGIQERYKGYKWVSGKTDKEVKFKALYGEYRKTEYDWILATTKGYLYSARSNKVLATFSEKSRYGIFATIYSKELFNNSKHSRRVSVKLLIAKTFYPGFDKYRDAVVCLDGDVNNLNIENLVVAKGARNGFVLDRYLYNRNHHQGELNEVILKDLVYKTGRG